MTAAPLALLPPPPLADGSAAGDWLEEVEALTPLEGTGEERRSWTMVKTMKRIQGRTPASRGPLLLLMLLVGVSVGLWLILLALLLERSVVEAGIVGGAGSDDEAPNVSSLFKASSELKDAISELEYSDSCSSMSCALFVGNGPAASRVGP